MFLPLYFSKHPLIVFMSLCKFSFFMPLPETAIYTLGAILSPQCILLQRSSPLITRATRIYGACAKHFTCYFVYEEGMKSTHFIEEKTEARRLTSPKGTKLSMILALTYYAPLPSVLSPAIPSAPL